MKNRLREFRKNKKIKLYDAANQVGISKGHLLRMEGGGLQNVSLRSAMKLAILYETTVEELFCLEECDWEWRETHPTRRRNNKDEKSENTESS